jgi:hypothetical protein
MSMPVADPMSAAKEMAWTGEIENSPSAVASSLLPSTAKRGIAVLRFIAKMPRRHSLISNGIDRLFALGFLSSARLT